MKIAYFSLFLSGIFFGGAFDHMLLAVLGSPLSAYGIQVGLRGNWALGIFDLVLAGVFLWFFHRKREPSR